MPILEAPALTDKARQRRDDVQRALVVLLVSTAILTILGVVMVFSATAPSSIRAVDANPDLQLFKVATRQAFTTLVGIVGLVLMALLPFQTTRRFVHVFLAIGLMLQGAVLVQGGEGVGGNNNWLSIGSFSVQPSEFLKIALVLWLAHMLGRLPLWEVEEPKTLVLPALGFIAAVGSVAAGGDMGTAIIFVAIAVGMFYLAGMKLKHLAIPMGLGALAAGMLIAAKPSRLRRVGEFFNDLFSLPDTIAPTQSEFAQFAFGTGGITGSGIGAGKEKWRDLSEAHTDFIFAVIGEELGLFGVLTVIAIFLAMGWALVTIIRKHPDRYAQLMAAGAGLWLCGQAFANMFVVSGLLPVFGVPLPFISMGGSSMLATLAMIGCVASAALAVPGVRESWRVRGRLAHGARTLVRSNR
ncbi:FtsW/RodA/SpoVE family cell cycle protein [Trueperella pecoris]|uniref:Probable peptidoglycan glycosyltransferase FtsW n=1 Tax=Trueperella pecoris TaxID=2733571 RepID=A0A7M1QW91_9ACTO|nr:FtsW/RodA/SpoVE family cell cycle protein [Trueperella pecoris]QOR46362.1 FtsW/RodA/SpoVE family cell cycle protein [Trueperella pecoris]